MAQVSNRSMQKDEGKLTTWKKKNLITSIKALNKTVERKKVPGLGAAQKVKASQ